MPCATLCYARAACRSSSGGPPHHSYAGAGWARYVSERSSIWCGGRTHFNKTAGLYAIRHRANRFAGGISAIAGERSGVLLFHLRAPLSHQKSLISSYGLR